MDVTPVFLVRGDDPVLLADAVRDTVKRAVGDEDPSLAVEDITIGAPEGSDDPAGVGAVLDACLTPPFLAERRVVVVRNAGALGADDAKRVATYLDDPLPTTVLVLVAQGGTVLQPLVRAVRAHGEVIDAAAPTRAADRKAWFRERLQAAPVRLEPRAAERLEQHLGEDIAKLMGVLDVLAARFGEGARIKEDDLEPFLGEAGGVAPWDLTDAIDRGDTAAALGYLHRMLGGGDRHPVVVLATLQRHVTNLLRLDGSGATSDAEAAAVLGIKGSPFPARKALTQVRRLGSRKVRRAVALVADADLELRGTKGWPEPLVLEVLVARLCQLARSG